MAGCPGAGAPRAALSLLSAEQVGVREVAGVGAGVGCNWALGGGESVGGGVAHTAAFGPRLQSLWGTKGLGSPRAPRLTAQCHHGRLEEEDRALTAAPQGCSPAGAEGPSRLGLGLGDQSERALLGGGGRVSQRGPGGAVHQALPGPTSLSDLSTPSCRSPRRPAVCVQGQSAPCKANR